MQIARALKNYLVKKVFKLNTYKLSAGDEIRTHTTQGPRILSPVRLPLRHTRISRHIYLMLNLLSDIANAVMIGLEPITFRII